MPGKPPNSRENDFNDDEFYNEPPARQGSSGLQNEDTRQTTDLSQSGGYGYITDQCAAETLVHLRDQTLRESNRTESAINGNANGQHERSMQYGSTGFWQPRSGTSNNLNTQQMAPHTQDGNNPFQNSLVYTVSSLQSTRFGLGRTLSSIQQNQSELQQKQEKFASALQNVVTVLQEMRTVALTNNQNEASSVSARLTLPNEAPQNPQSEVVSDGSNVSQFCQRNSSISYTQEHESSARMSSSRNLTQGSGQSGAPSYLNQGEESYENRTTDKPIYRQGMAPRYRQNIMEESMDRTYDQGNNWLSNRQDSSMEDSVGETVHRDSVSRQNVSSRDHTYNVRYQSGYESVQQRDHVLPTPVDVRNSTNIATDRTICRDNMDPTVYYRRADNTSFRQEHEEMSGVPYTEHRPSAYHSAPVGRNSSTGEVIDRTVHHDGDRQIYQQDDIMYCGTNTYPNHFQQAPGVGSSTKVETIDKTVHQDGNRHVYHQDDRANNGTSTYHSYLTPAPVDRNGTLGKTGDRTVYQQDGRMNCERNTYQNYSNSGYTQSSRLQRQRENGKQSSYNNDIKLPSFDGKEDWKVWISRFEKIAERKNWDDDMKLDNLLPKLQGRAGDFVFTQLPKYTLKCYSELVKELNSRFRVVETKRTFASKFSQRVQKQNETVEEYAADLKRLYSKAYQCRDASTRQEDLVRKFLDGLRDNDARFEIEYNKEPEDIDEAVYHALNFIQTRRRSNPDTFIEKKFKKFARRATEGQRYDTEEDSADDSAEPDHVCRVPTKSERPIPKKPSHQEKKSETEGSVTGSDGSLKLLSETRDLMQNLVTQVANIANGKQSTPITQPRANQPRRGVVCYGCNEQGHIIRDCPRKASRSEQAKPDGQNRDVGGSRRGRNENSNSNSPLN